MRLTDFLTDIGRPVAYFPSLTKITGGATHTLFLCQFLYWTGKQEDEAGWIYKTMEDITEETGLTRREQESARRALNSAGFLEEKKAGMPALLYYRVRADEINIAWDEHLAGTRTNKDVQNVQTRMAETSKQGCTKRTNRGQVLSGSLTAQSNPENNTIEYTENTTHISPVGEGMSEVFVKRVDTEKGIGEKGNSPASQSHDVPAEVGPHGKPLNPLFEMYRVYCECRGEDPEDTVGRDVKLRGMKAFKGMTHDDLRSLYKFVYDRWMRVAQSKGMHEPPMKPEVYHLTKAHSDWKAHGQTSSPAGIDAMLAQRAQEAAQAEEDNAREVAIRGAAAAVKIWEKAGNTARAQEAKEKLARLTNAR